MLNILSSANVLQESIDKAPAGATIKLSSGIYTGNIVINKALTILGKDENVIIQGNGHGKVILVKSSYVTLKNLHITGSGNRMENLDSAIELHHVTHCEISHCKITNSLYGIDMNMVEDSVISDNYIHSKENDISMRGDALKIWYAKNNLIKNNTIEYNRDITLTYSDHNIIEDNTFKHNRFGLHLSMSHQNIIRNNTFKYNSVGILLMGVKDTNVSHNLIASSKGAAGIAVVADKVSNFHFEHNILKYNAKALYIDTKSAEKTMQRYIRHNQLLYNAEALHFHASIKNNIITHNIIKGNMDDVIKDTRDGYTSNNTVAYNYWDRYAGFDKNRDHIGDTTHKNFLYADQLWHYDHNVKFFYGSPIMSLINFLSQLAPFIEPKLLLEDTKPLMTEEIMTLQALPLHQ
jgi:nitrous oxidase accessory protein